MLETVMRASRLLSVVAQSEAGELGISQMSEALGFPKSMVHRLATTLVHEGLLEQDPNTKLYRVGPQSFRIGARYRSSGVIERYVAEPFRREVDRLGYAGYIAVLEDTDALLLEALHGNARIRVATARKGDRIPAYATSVGKALLADLPPESREVLIARITFDPITQSTILDANRLREEMRLVSSRGYALSQDESTTGITSVGVAISDTDNLLRCAVSISLPTLLVGDQTIPLLRDTLFAVRDEALAAISIVAS